jgi:hypothetical protein
VHDVHPGVRPCDQVSVGELFRVLIVVHLVCESAQLVCRTMAVCATTFRLAGCAAVLYFCGRLLSESCTRRLLTFRNTSVLLLLSSADCVTGSWGVMRGVQCTRNPKSDWYV